MPLEYQSIKAAFENCAQNYEENAILQKEVLSRLMERLNDEVILDASLRSETVIDLASGTGWAIEGLTALFSNAQITALDFSQNMLNQNNHVNINKVCSDIHNLPFNDNSYDIIFSNMALHWCNESDVFNECMRILRPGGLLVMSCLGETSLYELKQAFKVVDNNPHVHDFPALHDLGDQLLNKGFEQVVVNAEIITLTYKNLKALMKDIKASGAQLADENRKKGMMTPLKFLKLQEAYEIFKEEGRLPASYEVVYLRAKKPTSQGDIGLTIRN